MLFNIEAIQPFFRCVSVVFFIGLLALIKPTNGHAAPVWKVSKGTNVIYIGGTIHLLSEQDYPLPNAFNLAYQASSELVFETDINSFSSPTVKAQFMRVLSLHDGKTIESLLTPLVYDSLVEFLNQRNLPIEQFKQLSLAGLNINLLIHELNRLDISSAFGVDAYFHSKATNSGKTISFLENIHEQINVMANINTLDADRFVESLLADLTQLKDQWPQLLTAWKIGDRQALELLATREMLNEWPEMYLFLLKDRNTAWVPKIKRMLRSPTIEFVLVGALHLVGEDNVLKQLEASGYTVEQLH